MADKYRRTALRLLDSAPVDLEDHVLRTNRQDRADIAKVLEGFAEKAALVAEYMNYRIGFGCGDQGHESAVKAANKARKSVRKAFGYSVTNPISF